MNRRRLTVIEKSDFPPKEFVIIGNFPTLGDIKEAIAYETGVEPQEQVLLHGDRLMFGGSEYSTRYDLRELPVINFYRRLLDDQILTVNVSCPGRLPVQCSLRAAVPVRELKNYVARRYCMAPWKQVLHEEEDTKYRLLGSVVGGLAHVIVKWQVLMVLKAPMLEPETVGAYAVRPEMDVSVCRYEDGRQTEVLQVTVSEEATGAQQRFAVERSDTLDVLLGNMERARMLQRGEKADLFNQQREPLDSHRSFEDYGLVDGDVVMLVRAGNQEP